MKIRRSFLKAGMAFLLVGSTLSAQDEAAATEGSEESGSMFPAWMDKVYAGVSGGIALAYTDIKQYPYGAPVFNHRTELGFGWNGFVGYKLKNNLGLEGTLGWVRLNGTKRSTSNWFTASVWQMDLGVRYNIANAIHKKSIETRKFDINLLAGLGTSAFRTSTHLLVNGYSSDPVITVQGYTPPTTGPAVLDAYEKRRRTMEAGAYGGVSASYRLNKDIDINADFKAYLLNTDLLDGLASTNNNTRDAYTYWSIGAIYHFGSAEASRSIDENSDDAKLDKVLEDMQDSDGDGVADYLDKDNNTPAGVKVYADGTAVDTDGDGVADYLDQQRVSPCKEVDANGVSKDSDSDGVADCNDEEPGTKAGSQVDTKGKAIATGGPVGVSPVSAATSDEAGASNVVGGARISGLPSIFFDSNSKSISYKNYAALTQVAQFMKANAGAKLVVVGNSDKVGSDEYNKVLAEKRAQSVVNYLVKNNGIEASRLTVVSKGSSEPISTKRNAYQNRRVDFLLGN